MKKFVFLGVLFFTIGLFTFMACKKDSEKSLTKEERLAASLKNDQEFIKF